MKKILMVGIILCAAVAQADKLAVWDLDHISEPPSAKIDEQEAAKKVDGLRVALLEHSSRSKTCGGTGWKETYGAIGWNEASLEDAIDSDNRLEVSFAADGEMDLMDLRLNLSFDMGSGSGQEITVAVFSSLTEEIIAGKELASKSVENGPGNEKMELKVPLIASEFQGVSSLTFYIYAYSSGDTPLGAYARMAVGFPNKSDGDRDITLNGVMK